MNIPEDQPVESGYREQASEPPDGEAPLRDLLAAYDQAVQVSLREAFGATTGLERVRVLHNQVRRSIVVHDAVIESTLCPLLEDLPEGSAIADRLRQGCRERAELLNRFEAISKGTAASNVYPTSGEEIERILEGLDHSFSSHLHDDTDISDALQSATEGVDPDVIVTKMAFEARHAPTRTHSAIVEHPGSALLKSLYRRRDRIADWVDTHHGWSDPRETRGSPRELAVKELKREAFASSPTVRDLLAGYDAKVDELIAEFRAARADLDKAEAVHRLNAALTIHDSVVAGVLCPLLDAVPGGKASAAQLRQECVQRGELQLAWNALTSRVSADDLYRLNSSEADEIIEPLIENFCSHEKEETLEVAELLDHLPDTAFRTKASPFKDFMWPWHSEGPAALAVRMALWADSSPTRAHSLLVRHPSSRALRSFYHFTDHFQDFWDDSSLERWVLPQHPARPSSDKTLPAGRAKATLRRTKRSR